MFKWREKRKNAKKQSGGSAGRDEEEESKKKRVSSNRVSPAEFTEQPFNRSTICWMYNRGLPPNDNECGFCTQFLESSNLVRLLSSRAVELGTLGQLKSWGERGCPLARKVRLHFAVNKPSGFKGGDAAYAQRIVTLQVWGENDSMNQSGCMNNFLFTLDNVSGVDAYTLKAYAREGAPAADYTVHRPCNDIVDSPDAFARVQQWWQTCIRDHVHCPKPPPHIAPARLLMITKEQRSKSYQVKLVDTANGDMGYAALSYVWGTTGRQIMATTLNRAALRTGLESDELPRTLADAVRCTYEIGLRYIWIDALCIFQDSLADKEREIAVMAEIYKSATVVLSAAMAADCEAGFLLNRKRAESMYDQGICLPIALPMRAASVTSWRQKLDADDLLSASEQGNTILGLSNWYVSPQSVWLVPQGEEEALGMKTKPLHEPISTRAWTFQESFLSTRLLMYASNQVLWSCKTDALVDGGIPSPLGVLANRRRILSQVQFQAFWRTVIQEYCQRKLSSSADKLSALDGVVQELSSVFSKVYNAGIWIPEFTRGKESDDLVELEYDLFNGLNWFQDPNHENAAEHHWNTDRSCPSWSWTKVDGGIHFLEPVGLQRSRCHQFIRRPIAVEITRHELTQIGSEQKLILEGSVELTGFLSPAYSPSDLAKIGFDIGVPKARKQPPYRRIYLDGGTTNPYFTKIDPTDYHPRRGTVTRTVLLLPLHEGLDYEIDDISGVVLVPLAGKLDTYQRIGFFALQYAKSSNFHHKEPYAFGKEKDFKDVLTKKRVVLL